MALKFNRVLEVVEVHVHAKFHKAECSGSRVIVSTNFFALSRNCKIIRKSGPVTLTFDLEILWVSSDCQGTCSSVRAKFHQVQQFMSYRAHREKLWREQYCLWLSRTVITMHNNLPAYVWQVDISYHICSSNCQNLSTNTASSASTGLSRKYCTNLAMLLLLNCLC